MGVAVGAAVGVSKAVAAAVAVSVGIGVWDGAGVAAAVEGRVGNWLGVMVWGSVARIGVLVAVGFGERPQAHSARDSRMNKSRVLITCMGCFIASPMAFAVSAA